MQDDGVTKFLNRVGERIMPDIVEQRCYDECLNAADGDAIETAISAALQQ